MKVAVIEWIAPRSRSETLVEKSCSRSETPSFAVKLVLRGSDIMEDW